MDKQIRNLGKIFKKFSAIGLAYFFGSRANGASGPKSDYDFAFYLDEKNKKKRFELRLKLIDALTKTLKTDEIDVIILNDAAGPELKYNIIKNGVLLYKKEPFKVLMEPRIMNEYFDFRQSLIKYGLTKA